MTHDLEAKGFVRVWALIRESERQASLQTQ
jgi:hypothetical protein